MTNLPLAIAMPGTMEMLVIGGIALLLFGKRLPEVARGFGKSIVEFKKGMKDINDDVSVEANRPVVTQTPVASQPKLDQANQI